MAIHRTGRSENAKKSDEKRDCDENMAGTWQLWRKA